jgi:hypothetical protein
MLPTINSDKNDRLKFHKRNFRLFVPTDFDYSPYFNVLKFPAWPLSMKESYRDLPWEEEPDSTKEEGKESNAVEFLKSLRNKRKKTNELPT